MSKSRVPEYSPSLNSLTTEPARRFASKIQEFRSRFGMSTGGSKTASNAAPKTPAQPAKSGK